MTDIEVFEKSVILNRKMQILWNWFVKIYYFVNGLDARVPREIKN